MCGVCQGRQGRGVFGYRFAVDFTLPALTKSASSGCKTCSMIYDGILCFEQHWKPASRVKHIEMRGPPTDSYGLLIGRICFVDKSPTLQIEFFKYGGTYWAFFFASSSITKVEGS